MLETERLILRRFCDADVDAIAAMRADARFMRFIKTVETRRETVAWMRMVSERWTRENLGFWALVLKDTGATIGWSGTWQLWETNEPEIGFAVAREFWGKGFATEAAQFALQFTFENRKAERTIAVAMPENAASRRVLEKLGMRFMQTRYFGSYGLTLVYYGITKNEYARNRQIDSSQIYAR
jgi:RimJ/RimL family protein N-acetyltransferase